VQLTTLTALMARARPVAAAALIAAALLSGAASLAEERAGVRVDVYTDEWIQVVSPAIEGGFGVGAGVQVNGGYSVDVLSGATRTQTVDVVSSATTFSERRHQASLSATASRHADRSATVGYTLSAEPDYVSNVGSVGFSKEILERMATVGGTYRLGRDRFGTATGEAVEGSAINQSLELGWSHILSRRTKGSLTLAGDYSACAESLGCQSSAYRFVPVLDLGAPQSLLSLRERHPETRLRGAGALRLSQALSTELALHASYRYYADSWEVRGHTASLAAARTLLDERLMVRLDARGGWQRPASFYRDNYAIDGELSEQLPDYRSADPELAGVTSAMARGRVSWTWFSLGPLMEFGPNVRVARLWYRYHELEELPERDAWMIGGGASGSF